MTDRGMSPSETDSSRDMLPNPTLDRAARIGHTTEDRKLLSWTGPERKRAAAYTESDPWRVMLVTAEFVQGLDALAEVGPTDFRVHASEAVWNGPLNLSGDSLGQMKSRVLTLDSPEPINL